MVNDSVYNFLSESGYLGLKDLQDCYLMVDDDLLNRHLVKIKYA
jgi:hypothetical protein